MRHRGDYRNIRYKEKYIRLALWKLGYIFKA